MTKFLRKYSFTRHKNTQNIVECTFTVQLKNTHKFLVLPIFTLLIFQTRENNRTEELLDRINQLECKEATILKEAHELREQNELLEFRILELEEGSCDKVSDLMLLQIYNILITFHQQTVAFKAKKYDLRFDFEHLFGLCKTVSHNELNPIFDRNFSF